MDTRTLCLGALTLGDASGYDVRKRFAERFGYFMDVSPSAIYPALAALHREELVAVTRVPQESRPDKKVYRITEAGRRTFLDALRTAPARHRVRSEFMILLFFSHLLPEERLDEVLDERMAEFERLIAMTEDWLEAEGAAAPNGVRFTADYGLVMMRTARDYIRANRHRLGNEPGADDAPTLRVAGERG